MAKQTINIGTIANDGTGSTLRAAGDLVNDNFNEIYTAIGDGTTLNSDVLTASSTHTLTNKSGNISQWTNDTGYITSVTETNDLTSAVTWANVPDVNITQSSVTQHEAALSITESQISDLQSYITASSTDTLTNKSGNISMFTNDSGYLTAETNDLTNVSGTLGTGNGGTGLTVIGTANQVLAVNSGAAGLEFQTI